MSDRMISCTLKNYPVRFVIATTTQIVQKMNEIHRTTPTAAAAAGRVLTGAALMGSMLKNDEDILTVTVKGSGDIGRVTATADRFGQVKCEILNSKSGVYTKDNGKLDVQKVVGQGTLTVIKDIGMRHPSMGEVDLISGEIAEDFAYYFAKSEQTPSIVALGVFVRRDLSIAAAGGYIIQLMPNCPEEMIDFLEHKAKSVRSITDMLLDGYDEHMIAREIFDLHEYEVKNTSPVKYVCNCSLDKIYKVLLSLGHNELQDIISSGKDIEIVCHFCNKKYNVTIGEIKELIESSK